MGSLKKDETQVARDYMSKSDVEGQAIETTYEVKRDLGRRHINMIAIAGMIVCDRLRSNSPLDSFETHRYTDAFLRRVLVCS
jgi:hypothetical protein